VTIDTPQSPRSAPVRNLTYCSESGRSRPSRWTQRVDRFATRLVAEDQLRRIAGDDPYQHEDERQDREQRDAGKGEPPDEERGHAG
jgi:hypothetical protein